MLPCRRTRYGFCPKDAIATNWSGISPPKIRKHCSGRMAELNDYTRIVSPGILKRTCVEGKSFVVKSVPPADTEAQRNELKSALAILEVVNRLAPSPATRLGFDVTVTVPEAACRTRTGRILSVMPLHPYPTLDAVLVRYEGGPDDMSEHLENGRALYDLFSRHGIFWQDMAPRNILVDGRRAPPRYVILDFEKTRMTRKRASGAARSSRKSS